VPTLHTDLGVDVVAGDGDRVSTPARTSSIANARAQLISETALVEGLDECFAHMLAAELAGAFVREIVFEDDR